MTRRELDTTLEQAGGPAELRGGMIMAIGDGQVLTRALDRPELILGRDPGCDFTIDHRSLSRRHARLILAPTPMIQDLGSTNGTRVDGVVRRGGEPVPIAHHTGFEIGPFVLVMVGPSGVARASASGRESLRIDDPTPAGVPAIVREFARGPSNLLITGETGVGKEVLAATLHELSGRSGPLIAINCAALAESLLESELFGHERGAYTGAVSQRAGLIEAADQGTVFLDEVGELPPATQAKLLRVIERREITRLGSARPIAVDVRFLAATHRDLAEAVAARRFREDLFFRLDGVTLVVPPLRERAGQIAPLALRFLAAAQSTARPTAPPGQLSAEVIDALRRHRWPGNVRELKAVIERAVVLARGGPIEVRHLVFGRTAAPSTAPPPGAPVETADAPLARGEVAALGPAAIGPSAGRPATSPDDDPDERARIIAALAACAGNQTRAAKLLGISRTTMVTKLRIYQIPRPTRG
jgi:two-component system response regulator AtoC